MSADEKLTAVAESYRKALPEGEVAEFGISGLDHTGVPVWTAALWPRIGSGEGSGYGPFCNGVGYGLTEEAARTSAYGECVEAAGAWSNVGRMDRTRATHRELVREYGEDTVMDPATGCLPAGSGYTPEIKLDWVRVRRYPGGEPVLLPVEFVATRGADLPPDAPKPLFTPVTNGLGAGLGLDRALSHAVLEILQRDGNGLAFRALDRGISIGGLEDLADTGARELLERLDSEGISVTVKLAATDFGFTNVYAVGEDRDPAREPHPLTLTACGEACHPDRDTAIRKAVAEFCASRSRKPFNHGPLAPIARLSPPGYVERFREQPLGSEEDRSLTAMLEWLSLPREELRRKVAGILGAERTVPYQELPTTRLSGGPAELMDLLRSRLSDEGFEVFYVDISPDGSATSDSVNPVTAVKAVVPGLEVETLSYGRIGSRNLDRLLERDLGLVGLGPPPADRPRARRILLTEAEEARRGPAWFDYAAAESVVGDLYPLYREPGRHVAALAAEREAG